MGYHTELEVHTWQCHSLRGVLARADQTGIGVIGGHFYTHDTEGSD